MILLVILALASDPVIDCNLVRQYVAEHGRAKALAWARYNGYTWEQIAEARKCLSH